MTTINESHKQMATNRETFYQIVLIEKPAYNFPLKSMHKSELKLIFCKACTKKNKSSKKPKVSIKSMKKQPGAEMKKYSQPQSS
jgi:hypothetical protein